MGPSLEHHMLRFDDGSFDGAISADGRVAGCYVHGLFAGDAMRAAWLARLGGAVNAEAYESRVEASLDTLAAAMESHLDVDAMLAIAAAQPRDSFML